MIHDDDTTQPALIQTLGRYQVLCRVGKGGMGDVWLCEDPRLHRQVAIKTLPTHSQSDHEFSLRFEREAQAAAALNHPHILPVHDYGKQPLSNGQVITYIVMPYISGGSLADRIATSTSNNTVMPPQQAIDYLSQAAEAIDYAHNQGVVHRDIKPGNMLLRSDNWLLLADFGIAHIVSSEEQMTQAGVGIGTPEYMAPEQAMGKAEVASDNYSLAVVAYQLVTGQLPFKADTGYAITIQHMTMPPPLPQQFNPNLSPSFAEVLLRGLAKEPQQRFQSAQAFVAELQRTLANAPFEATYVSSPLPATIAAPISTPDGRGPVTRTTEQNSKLATPQDGKPTITRRQLMIGGGAALLTVGGVGAWEAISRLHHTNQQQGNTTIRKTSASPPTPDPNGPSMTLLAHDHPVTSLAWSPVTNTLASSDDAELKLWDIQAGQTRSPQPINSQSSISNRETLLAWSNDGKMLAIGNAGSSSDNRRETFVYKSNLTGFASPYKETSISTTWSVNALCWTPDKSIITTELIDNDIQHFLLRVWNQHLPTTHNSLTLTGRLISLPSYMSNLIALSPHGLTAAIGTADKGVLVGQIHISETTISWHQITSLLPVTSDPLSYVVDSTVWSPDGRYVAAAMGTMYRANQIFMWDLQNNYRLYGSPLSPPDQNVLLHTVTWSPKNTVIAAGGSDGHIYVWTVSKEHTLRVLTGTDGNVTALAWSRDGSFLAASYDNPQDSILVWKL